MRLTQSLSTDYVGLSACPQSAHCILQGWGLHLIEQAVPKYSTCTVACFMLASSSVAADEESESPKAFWKLLGLGEGSGCCMLPLLPSCFGFSSAINTSMVCRAPGVTPLCKWARTKQDIAYMLDTDAHALEKHIFCQK